MSDMVTRYNASDKPRPAQAKQIPDLATNFFDQQSQFAEGFTTFEKKGEPTNFTERALKYYNEERRDIIIPDGYQPIEPGVPLNRWTPEKKYHVPGAPGS